MKIIKGSTRRVFVFNHIVIKTPLSFGGWLTNISEVYFWNKYIHLHHELCPVLWSDPLRLFIVMPRVRVLTHNECWKLYISIVDNMAQRHFKYPVFDDIHEHNLGILNGMVVKIDYGIDYWLYNLWISIRFNLKKKSAAYFKK
jgi:hypothetical protein